METKKLILSSNDVGYLASAIALQDGRISLAKDTESSFYIATIEGDAITIPENLRALEIQPLRKEAVKEKGEEKVNSVNQESQNNLHAKNQPNSTDLILRLHLNQTLDPAKFPILYQEIAKAIELVIKNNLD